MKSFGLFLALCVAVFFALQISTSARQLYKRECCDSEEGYLDRQRAIEEQIESQQGLESTFRDFNEREKANAVFVELGKKYQQRLTRMELQRKAVETLYTNILWPTSSYLADQIEKGNYDVVSSILTADVKGRINPLGRFDSYTSTGEYFYALAGPLPGVATAGRTRCTGVLFDRPITCEQNSCTAHAVITLTDFNTNKSAVNYTHIGFFNFNEKNQVCAYEANFLGLSRRDAAETPAARATFITNLCTGIQASCVGANQQFASAEECVSFMNSIPYGGWGQADQNTQQCRSLHLSLVRANPAVHCMHCGPTGGGKCVPHAETTYFGEGLDDCRDKNW